MYFPLCQDSHDETPLMLPLNTQLGFLSEREISHPKYLAEKKNEHGQMTTETNKYDLAFSALHSLFVSNSRNIFFIMGLISTAW
jgi:hypothetical protein